MQLDRKIIENIMGPIGEGQQVNVSLFIVSAKHPRLKKLDLDPHLSPEARAKKLHKWAQEHRFVAVIAMGDKVFAHANADYAAKLQGMKDLSIDGKKVSVKELTAEESDQLSSVGEAFEQYLLQESEEEEAAGKPEKAVLEPGRFEVRQFLSSQKLVSDQMHMDYVIASMQNVPGQVILNCLRQMSEARREAEKEKKEDEKRSDIKGQQIKKEILKREIIEGEIKGSQLKQDAVRVNKIRSA